MKNLIAISVVLTTSWLGLGCAGSGVTRVGSTSATHGTRGSLVTHGHSVRAIVQGPTVIHAYAAESGGDLYAVPAVTGSDADCGPASSNDTRRGTTIRPDQRVVLAVEPGQIACLASSRTRSFELLWHAHEETESHGHETQLALAARRHKAK